MKARVKGTNNIIDVEFDKDAFNEGYPPYWEKENNMFYQPEQLEWIDNEENAGMAMQGILANYGVEPLPDDAANDAYNYAHALVEKMKEDSVAINSVVAYKVR